VAFVKTKPNFIELQDIVWGDNLDFAISLWGNYEHNFGATPGPIVISQTVVLGLVLKTKGAPRQNVYIPFWGKNVKIKNFDTPPWTNFLFDLIENLKEE
jgi:hypothetical protein